MTSIVDTLNNVSKTRNTPTYIEGAELLRENLDSFVNDLTSKETPLRDRLSRKKGNGAAASWNIKTAKGTGVSAFAEGGTPTESATTVVRASALYKELGATKSISDRMIAAGQTFIDIESFELETAIREVIEDEEVLIVNGDATVNPLQFDGLSTQIVTNVIDTDNNALGFYPDLINQGVETVMKNYGVKPTAIYTGFGMQRAINNSLSGDIRFNLDQGNDVSVGVNIGNMATMAGKLPFVNTFAIEGDSVTYAGFTVEDIFIVCEKSKGDDIVYVSELYGLGKVELGRVGAAIKFMVTESSVLVNKAEQMHVKITNVRVA